MRRRAWIAVLIALVIAMVAVAPAAIAQSRHSKAKSAAARRHALAVKRERAHRLAAQRRAAAARAAAAKKAAAGGRWMGIFIEGAPADLTSIQTAESKLGTHLAVINYFQDTSHGFPQPQADNAAAHGSTLMVTLEFWGSNAKQVAAGDHDVYLHQFARDAKAYGHEIYLRPFHEMNGRWYPWAGTVQGVSPHDVVNGWRHVKQIFDEEGATNVKFVWSPNKTSVPNVPENAIAKYWPGDAYVDYIALDGYNFAGKSWNSFEHLFTQGYKEVTALSKTKPIMIAETSCTTAGGDKATWIRDMFNVIPQRFPRVKGVVWFNEQKERDWRFDSSPQTLAAFQAGLKKF